MKTMPMLTLVFMFAAAAYAQDHRLAKDVDPKNYANNGEETVDDICAHRKLLGIEDDYGTGIHCAYYHGHTKDAEPKENSDRVPSSDSP